MEKDNIKIKINSLRKILNKQIENNEQFENIIKTSREIDILLNIYYDHI